MANTERLRSPHILYEQLYELLLHVSVVTLQAHHSFRTIFSSVLHFIPVCLELKFSLTGLGEGNGTPLQYSCLENPMDGAAWWAAVHGVVEGWTRLHFHFHFSLSCIGEGNGNPLQCSCLEDPRDRDLGGLPSMGSHRVGHD